MTETASPTVVISDVKRDVISPVFVSSKNSISCLTIEANSKFRRRWIRLVLVTENIKPRRPDVMTLNINNIIFLFRKKNETY